MTVPLFFSFLFGSDDSVERKLDRAAEQVSRENAGAKPPLAEERFSEDAYDAELIRRMGKGDGDALREFYQETYAHLSDFALSLTANKAEAEEIVQDAYVLLWTRASEWNTSSHVRGFLYRTVRNMAYNRKRNASVAAREAQRDAASIIAASMAAPADADTSVLHREIAAAVVAAVYQLPEPRRTALVLRWREQMSYEEIARVLEITPATARQHVTRARASLRATLTPILDLPR